MIDRLMEKIKEKENPSIVGLDPVMSIIPEQLKKEGFDSYGKTPEAVGRMFFAFNKAIIDAVYDIVPAVKPQIAMYELYGLEGIRAYLDTTNYAKDKGLLIIGDIKRGDIASTAEAYAGHLAGVDIEGTHWDLWREDGVTLNPYMGYDGIGPFIKACRNFDKGLFILVRTSNPSGAELQDLLVFKESKIESGADIGAKAETEAGDGVAFGGEARDPLYCHVADLVAKWGLEAMGTNGYSKIGAVVGATNKEQGVALRKRMPHTFFLVPGYGAQGGKAQDLKGFADKNGGGLIVNSSRGIIAAYKQDGRFSEQEFALAAREAALAMKTDLQQAMKP